MEIIAPHYFAKTRSGQVKIKDYRSVLFILHDQLNLSVFPTAITDRKPLIVVVESFAYATSLPFHQMKLAYLISAQRHFAIDLTESGFDVITLFTQGWPSDGLKQLLETETHLSLIYMTPSEWDTRQKMKELELVFPDRVKCLANTFFIADVNKYRSKITKGYRLETFYRELRQETGYLMEYGKPIGGKWNYDKENRKSLPKKITIPTITCYEPNAITQEVIIEVKKRWGDHFGKLDRFGWAVTRNQALELATEFIQARLANFGPYEDAIKTKEPFLFHSVLALYLNNGLLLPQELCQMAIDRLDEVSINSVEGFIRQILGWREYIRVYYEVMMPGVRTVNYFNFSYTLPQLFWDGETKLKCLSDTMESVIELGFSHHIQRLMILSNFSNLTMTNPIELHHWFWLAYIDAYEWVELPNVLGMSTYADGGILASKPYVSGGNYIQKMSDCCSQCFYDVKQKTGAKACPFNYLYWNFVDRYREDFKENGRVSLMVAMYEKKTELEKKEIRQSAEDFIEQLPRYQSIVPTTLPNV